jgi:hypothetical protein
LNPTSGLLLDDGIRSFTLLQLHEISVDSPFKHNMLFPDFPVVDIQFDNPFKSYQRKMLLNTTTGSLLAGSRVVSSSLQSQRQKTNFFSLKEQY